MKIFNIFSINEPFKTGASGSGLGVPYTIQYNMSVMGTELDGTRYIRNYGKGGNSFNAEAFASNPISLNGTTQSVPYPVLHDLGADTKQTATLGTGWVDNTGHSYTATNASSDLSALSTATTDNVLIDFTISNYTAGDVNGESANGTYQVSVTNDSLTGTSFSGDVLINSVQEITLPTASYLTIMQADGTIKQLSSTGDVGGQLLNDTAPTVAVYDSTYTFSSDTDNSFDLAVTVVGTNVFRPLVETNTTDNLTIGRQYAMEIIPTISSGNLRVSGVSMGGTQNTSVGYDLTDGVTQYIYMENDAGATYSKINFKGTQLFDASILWKLREVLAVSTTYSVTDSHQFVFNHTSPLSAADKLAIEQDPNLAFRMFFDGEILPSGFNNTDVGWFSGGNEGLASAEKVYDLSDQAFLTYVSIVNYDTATKTTLANQSKGASNLKLIRNVSGGTTGTVLANTTQWEADGRTAVTNWTIIAPFTITEYIGGAEQILSSDLATSANPTYAAGDETSTFAATSTTGFDLAVTVIGTNNSFPRVNKQLTSTPAIGTKIYIEFDAVINSGTCIIRRVNIGGDVTIIYTIVNGKNKIEITTTTENTSDSFYFDGTNLFDIEITNWTAKELTGADIYTFISDGNRYKNAIADGIYTLPTGVWTLDEFGFDGVTPVVVRGKTSLVDAVIIP